MLFRRPPAPPDPEAPPGRPGGPPGDAPDEVPTDAPDLTRLLKARCRDKFTPAELWLLTCEAVLDVPGAKLLALARGCGWTDRGFRLVLASLAAKLAR